MKIRKLAIENIASIAEAELDFAGGALRDESLFLICGDTGAGKTTLLDAICLALYGATPRYAPGNRTGALVGNMKSDDPRQLVRHGAALARAVLTLQGNDGRDYEASWSVEVVSRGKNKGELKGAEWEWRDCSPGGLVYKQKKDCEDAAHRAVGLDFGQFCRTTLLAQGQFTKFLLGSDEEKSRILEKLTDTSKYSALGRKIKDAYALAAKTVTDLKGKIDALAGLGKEERAALEGELVRLDSAIGDGEKKWAATRAKAEWLKRTAQLKAGARDASDALAAAYAALKAVADRKDCAIGSANNGLKDVCEFLASEAAFEGMYENAEVIAANLRDARNAEAEKTRVEGERDRLVASRPGIEDGVRQAEGAQGEAEMAAREKKVQLDAAEAELAAMGLGRLRDEKDALAQRVATLGVLASKMDDVRRRQEGMERRRGELKSMREEHGRIVADLPRLKAAMEDAGQRLASVREDRDRQKALIDDGIKAIVAELNVGDTCPICGNRIARLNGEEYFTKLFAELNGACNAAEAEFKSRERACNQAAAKVDALGKSLEGEARKIEEEEAALRDAVENARRKALECGISELTPDSLAAARLSCEERGKALSGKLSDGEAKEREIKALRDEERQLGTALSRVKEMFVNARAALHDCDRQIEAKRASAVSASARAGEKLSAAAEKVVLADWERLWRSDPEGFEGNVIGRAKEYRLKKESRQSLENRLEALRRERDGIGRCIGRAEDLEPALASVAAAEGAEDAGTSEVDACIGRLTAARKELSDHEARRPDALSATDTEEALSRMAAEQKAECDDLQRRMGSVRQELDADAERGKERDDCERALFGAQESLREWKTLYDLFGDNDGKKVRAAIQSYVLKNVLVKANAALKRLADRYELACEGLTLTVRDSFEGGVERPVDTLSGGEGFLVSLALALGLAGVNERGLGVDMLFIDEGFGTLSGEHLDRAVESLENLNAVCGCRKVGVISHVERLREKIRAHVEVTREGHDPSVVRVGLVGQMGPGNVKMKAGGQP